MARATAKKSRKTARRSNGGFLARANNGRSLALMAIVVVAVVVAGYAIVKHSLASNGIDPTTWAPSGTGAWYFDRTNLTGGTVADYQQREQQFGRKFDGHMFYMHSQVTAADFSVPSWSINTDHAPFVTLSWGENPPSTILNDVASGADDANIKFFADNVKSQLAAGHVFIRPFYEFNITGNPYNASNNPTLFIKAWQHFVTVFKGEGATNARFIWEPNRMAGGSVDPVPYYPGSSYVDWIGIDAYPKTTYLTLQQLVTTGSATGEGNDWYDTFKSYGKPLAITEIGIQQGAHYGSGFTRAQWWSTALSDMKALPGIRMFEYFDSNNPAATPYNWLYDAPGTASGDSGAQGLAAAAGFSKNCFMNTLSTACGGQGSGSPSAPPPSPSTASNSPSPTCSPLPSANGTDTMAVNAPTSGTYRVWARMMVPDAVNNTLGLQVDQSYCNIMVGGSVASNAIPAGVWTWVNYASGNTGSAIQMDLAAGPHTVIVSGPNPGVKLDRLVFTTDTSCVPTGTGDNCGVSVSPSLSPSTLPPSPSLTPSIQPPPSDTVTPSPTPTPSLISNGTATVQDTGDATVIESEPNKNFSTQTKLQIGAAHYRALLKFNLGKALPAGATPVSAKLQMFVTDQSVANGVILAHHESNSWLAPNVTWNNQPDWETGSIGKTATTPTAQHFISIPIPLSALNLDGYSSLGLSYSVDNGGSTEIASHEAKNIPTLYINYSNGGGGGDTQPPTAPTSFKATATSPTTVSTSWGASTDNVGVDHYIVERSGQVVGQVGASTLSFVDSSALPQTTYTYTARAYDAAGNQSISSNAVTLTTPTQQNPDVTPPTPPGNLTGSLVATNQVNLSWTASTDNVGVAGYRVFQNGTQIATLNASATTFGVASLAPGTTFTWTVKAFDAAGNVSDASNAVTITTPPNPSPGPSSPPPTSPPPPPPGAACGTTTSAPSTYQHVIWIWMENHSFSDVIGNSQAPYMTSLAKACGTATNYTMIHRPSLPNYIAATSGGDQGITDDKDPTVHKLTVDNLFRQVRSIGKTEKSYEEGMPSNCNFGPTYAPGQYAVKHNPEAYYQGGTDHTSCTANNVPMGTVTSGNFLSDLNGNKLPNFSFITPNLCNDTHDCLTPIGDAWIKSWMPIILGSPEYASGNTAVIVMYDEPNTSTGSIGTSVPNIMIAPSVKPGTVSSTAFNHYSLLRATEDMLGISSHLGGAASANSLRGPFNF